MRISMRLLLWCLLLPLLAPIFVLFTEQGSRWVLDNAGRLLPLEIEYSGGTLAGELALRRIAWSGDTVELELLDLELELAPACLWRSAICFQQLYARQLDIMLLSDSAQEQGQPEPDRQVTLVEFPLPLEAAHLQLDTLRVQWDGGEWRQGSIEGSVQISDSTIRVGRALVKNALLTLTGEAQPGETVQLPRIHLPLELVVDELVLMAGSWDRYGQSGRLDSLQLRGNWTGQVLRLDELQVRAAAGQWHAAAGIEFAGNWPLTLAGQGVLPSLPHWPQTLERAFELKAGGDLAALALDANIRGETSLSATALVNALSAELPFRLVINADWPGKLALTELADLPESLASVEFSGPAQLTGSGSLKHQVFQLEATMNGFGYEALDIDLAGSHHAGRFVLEDFSAQDADAANAIRGSAELDYAQQLRWSAILESSGLDLLPLNEYGAAHVKGRLQVLGYLDGDDWQMSLEDADLSGSVNGLPTTVSGHTGIDSQLRLLASDLQADVNGARLLLLVPADNSQPGKLDIMVENLGRWLPGGGGGLSLHAAVTPGWEDFSVTGSLLGVRWQGLRIGSGTIDGNYGAGEKGAFSLDVKLADLATAGMELGTLQLSARGSPAAQTLSLRGQGDIAGALQLTGEFGDGGQWSGRLAPTTLQTPVGNWLLGESVALDFSPAPGRLRVSSHCWTLEQTRICPGAALLAEEGSGSLEVDGELADLAELLPGDLDVQGTLAAQFTASWSASKMLAIDGEIAARDVLLTRNHGDGEFGTVSWQKIEADIHNGANGLSLSAGVSGAGSRIVDLAVRLPADREQALSGTLVISALQLATLAPFAPTLAVLQGELGGTVQLAGTINRPLADGELHLSGGQFALLENPTELRQLELQLSVRGDRAGVQGSGILGGGQVAVRGEISARPDWRLQLAIEGERQEILLPPYTQMLVSEKLDLILAGDLLDLQGDIVVHEGSLSHEQLPAGAVNLSDDVVEVDYSGNVISERVPFDTTMNVNLLIKDTFRILGDTLNATLGGDLQLRQKPRQPLQVFGNLHVIEGELRAYQQSLRITRGTLGFAGTPDNPSLNVRAQRQIAIDNVVVGLQLRGNLKQPRLEVFSEPTLSQGDIMSYLVRGRRRDSGAEADGVAMALSLGSGLVNQSPLVTELNRIPGVNNIAFSTEGSTEEDTAATVGGYIGERLYLSYGMGIYEPINVLTARLYMKSRLWLEVVSRLESSVDLYYSFDIE